MPTHAIIWIDHKEAHVFHVRPGASDETTVVSPHHFHRHPTGHGGTTRHAEDTKAYFDSVAGLLNRADEVLVVGPSTAKLEFLRHVKVHDRAFASKVVGVEAVDHPTDAQVVSYARKYFKRTDRMRAT